MCMELIYPFVKYALGTLYPAYKTWKALKRKDETTRIIIIMWLVYGTKIIYDSIVDRELKKREKAIDKWLTRTYKLRDEVIALVWFELSRFSVRIVTALMSAMIKSGHGEMIDSGPNNRINYAAIESIKHEPSDESEPGNIETGCRESSDETMLVDD